ncbi:hypothetical protein OV203_20620 [Nannocystis sp. ILAH1]|uniref:hypothetical protein n=1 Tax=unclassified Nannocystis TaxID=2627009 RepID=UPI00226ECE8B|nr:MULTISPECIES: hypothetical protein [unclassified Nannocystis]MCY0989553.1 hypothetical protein [Nannocystis sp. ILAH1]MCY1064828.1 hypothetical protein [Nannocystis sp. RBIL2]
MIKANLSPMALSLAVLFACNPDKNPIDSTTDEPSTESAGTDSTAGDPTGDPSGDPTGDEPIVTTTEGDTSTSDPTEGPGDTTGPADGEGAPCIDTPTVIAVDADTPLGNTAQGLLADKLGPRSTLLTFAEEPLSLADAWRGVTLPLSVELRYEGGEIRWIESEINPEFGGEGFPGECLDRLEVDVGFDFVTEGLEFDEHRDGVLQFVDAESASLRVELLPPGLNGSLDPATLYKDEEPQWVVTGIEIGATFQGAALGGSLLNEVHVGDDESGFVGFGNVGWWGDPIEP